MKRNPRDEESQSLKGLDAAPPETTTSVASASKGNNPIWLTKLVLRKVLTMLTTDDGSDDIRSLPLSLVKDVLTGMIVGFVVISSVIFLDYINILHIQSAHAFRENAIAILNDPETIANIEEAGNIKIITPDQHDKMKRDLIKFHETIKELNGYIRKRERQITELNEEIAPLRKELNDTIANITWGYHQWCGTCKWGGGVGNCDARKQYFRLEYAHSEISAKYYIIKNHPSCRNETESVLPA